MLRQRNERSRTRAAALIQFNPFFRLYGTINTWSYEHPVSMCQPLSATCLTKCHYILSWRIISAVLKLFQQGPPIFSVDPFSQFTIENVTRFSFSAPPKRGRTRFLKPSQKHPCYFPDGRVEDTSSPCLVRDLRPALLATPKRRRVKGSLRHPRLL